MAGRDNRLSAFVGNLPPFVIQGHFDHIFAGCKLSSVRMIRDRETDEFKGCAFVDFEDEESLQTALRTNGSVVEGYQIRVSHAMDRRGGGPRGGSRGGAGNGYGGRGGPRGGGGYDGRGGGSRGGGSGGQEGWSFRGRPSTGGGRYAGGPRGGMGGRGGPDHRPSYHPPGIPRDSIQRTGRSFTFDQTPEVNSNSSDDRPRLNLKPRTVPLDSNENRQLTDRDKAIFGTGRPREASPTPEAPVASDAQTAS